MQTNKQRRLHTVLGGGKNVPFSATDARCEARRADHGYKAHLSFKLQTSSSQIVACLSSSLCWSGRCAPSDDFL